MLKKFFVLLLLAVTALNGCASYTINQSESNDEILKKLKEDGRTVLTYVGEYSYVSEPGQFKAVSS